MTRTSGAYSCSLTSNSSEVLGQRPGMVNLLGLGIPGVKVLNRMCLPSWELSLLNSTQKGRLALFWATQREPLSPFLSCFWIESNEDLNNLPTKGSLRFRCWDRCFCKAVWQEQHIGPKRKQASWFDWSCGFYISEEGCPTYFRLAVRRVTLISYSLWVM